MSNNLPFDGISPALRIEHRPSRILHWCNSHLTIRPTGSWNLLREHWFQMASSRNLEDHSKSTLSGQSSGSENWTQALLHTVLVLYPLNHKAPRRPKRTKKTDITWEAYKGPYFRNKASWNAYIEATHPQRSPRACKGSFDYFRARWRDDIDANRWRGEETNATPTHHFALCCMSSQQSGNNFLRS